MPRIKLTDLSRRVSNAQVLAAREAALSEAQRLRCFEISKRFKKEKPNG